MLVFSQKSDHNTKINEIEIKITDQYIYINNYI